MMKIFLILTVLMSFSAYAEELIPIEVTDQTVKIGAAQTEELYFGFEEGDIILFSFEEIDGKPLKGIEIIELPSSSKFSDFKSSKIDEKRIRVLKKAVYKFSFKNGAITKRICKVRIKRIPANQEAVNFNTAWKWETIYDTTFIPYTEDSIVGYDSTYVPYTKLELVKVDTSYWDKEKNERVHTLLNQNGDKTVIWFDFPEEVKTKYLVKENIAWAWWFGTEDEPDISSVLEGAGELVSTINPVAGLALGVLSLTQKNTGKNVKYYQIKDYDNAKLFLSGQQFLLYDQGDGSTISHRSTDHANGRFYIGFDNDHTYPVDVNVKFSVVVLTKTFEDREYKKLEVTPRTVKLNKVRMEVTSKKERVCAG